jgi:hypothetical protein
MVSRTMMFVAIIAAVAVTIGASAAAFYSQGPTGSPNSQTNELSNTGTTEQPAPSQPIDEVLLEATEAETVEKELSVQVRFAENPLSLGNTQTIYILVLDAETQEPVKDASVQIKETYGTRVKNFAGYADEDGSVSFSWAINDSYQLGTHETIVRASANQYSVETVETRFEVVDSDH